MPVAGLGLSKNSSAATLLIDRAKTNQDTMVMMMIIIIIIIIISLSLLS